MIKIPDQCTNCINFNEEDSFCKIHEQLPGEYGREDVVNCPSFIDKHSTSADNLELLMKYMDEEATSDLEQKASLIVDSILKDYESKYKVLVVGIARRKIKSIIKMVDIIDYVLDKMDKDTISDLAPNQAIRLLSELNNSVNNDLAFIMKLVNPDTQLRDLQVWMDNRSVVNIEGVSESTNVKADELLKLSGASRDKVREAFDSILRQVSVEDSEIEIPVDTVDSEGEYE